MNCKICHKEIIQGERYFDSSDSYEYAELGHKKGCWLEFWDYKTLGSSQDKMLKEGVLDIPPLTPEEREEQYFKFRV